MHDELIVQFKEIIKDKLSEVDELNYMIKRIEKSWSFEEGIMDFFCVVIDVEIDVISDFDCAQHHFEGVKSEEDAFVEEERQFVTPTLREYPQSNRTEVHVQKKQYTWKLL